MITVSPVIAPQLLMVDDEARLLETSSTIIRRNGYAVMTATFPAQAVAIVARHLIDLAILDYDLSPTNGAQLAIQLRNMVPKLKTILYSGSLDIPSRDIGLVDIYVTKADGIFRLLDCVSDLLWTGKVNGNGG